MNWKSGFPKVATDYESNLRLRAESDEVAGAGAGENAAWVIVGVGVGSGARRLEQPRVSRGLALLRTPETAGAAVPRGPEGGASALAGDYTVVAAAAHCQAGRADLIQIPDAAGTAAPPTAPAEGRH